MKRRLQGLIAGVLIGTMLTGWVVFAKNIQETINAVYMNVKLVIDGEEITPKDVNGNVVEPFIYNGTTYLPVRAIGEAFNKDVHWDGETATVYVGDIVKPAKEVYLYDKPYKVCENSSEFRAEKKEKESRTDITSTNYIGFNLDTCEEKSEGVYEYKNSVTYAINGAAKKVKGTFKPFVGSHGDATECYINFYNENGKLLYKSPTITPYTSDFDFEFSVEKSLELKIEFCGYATSDTSWTTAYLPIRIENFAILTTNY